MALVKFLKGNLANLSKAPIQSGQLVLTVDEKAMYFDVDDSTRIRLGDFQEFATLADLEKNTNPSTTALYYVNDINVLAKWNGTGYVQINLNTDTGATSFEVVGDGNAVTSVSYDPDTRKLTLNKDVVFATKSELDALDSFVGDIPEGYTEETIVAYINKKAEETLASATGGSSESAASVLAALNTYKSENDPKVQANTDAIDAIKDGAAVDSFADVETELGKKVDKVEGKSLILDSEIARLGGMSDGANKVEKSDVNGNIKVDGEEVVVYTHPDKHVIGDITGLQDALDGKQAAGDYSVEGHKHVKEDITDFAHTHTVSEITDFDDKVKAYDYATKSEAQGYVDAYKATNDVAVKANADAIGVLNGNSSVDGSVDKKIADAINDFASKVSDDQTVNTYKELIDYAASHGSEFTELVGEVDVNTGAIATLNGGVEVVGSVDKKISDAISGANLGQYALDSDLDAVSGRVDVLEAIDHDAYVGADTALKSELEGKINAIDNHSHSNKVELDKIVEGDKAKWDAMEQNAKDYADGINSSMNTRVEALEAIDHSHDNKDVLDGITAQNITDWNDAVSKEHEHANKSVLDGITSEKVSAWDGAEQNAKDHADGLNTAMNTRVEALEAIDHEAYKGYVDAALTWGEF